jgi:hypothetical protein
LLERVWDPMRRAHPPPWLFPLVLLAGLLAARDVRAQSVERVRLDWDKLAMAIRNGGDLLPHEQPWRPPSPADTQSPSPATSRPPGLTPNVSLVARDWGGAQLLVGHLLLTDQIRLSRSMRMVLTRVRLADERIAPFAQIGLGQWRVDTDLMPALPRDTELAAQLGGGFELKLGWRSVVAFEIDYTMLYREAREPEQLVAPRVLGAFVASRTVF